MKKLTRDRVVPIISARVSSMQFASGFTTTCTGERAAYRDRVLSARRILELANKAHFLYVTQKPAEQANLLRMVLSNCSVDAASLYPIYRKPFDLIFERAKTKEWSGREDLNLRPPGPEPDSTVY